MAQHIGKFLQEHQLRVTNCRKDVLKTFFDKQSALSHSDLEDVLSNDYDRVTIYRTLKTFLEHDLIHKVLDDSGATKYALCAHQHHGGHDHEHVHFKCEKCGKTVCLDQVALPEINLPEGYLHKEVNLLVTGVCNKCG